MRRIVLGALGAGVFLGAALFVASQISIVQDALVRRVIRERLIEQRAELFEEDALRVLLCGTSSPAPDPVRGKSCVAVFAAGRFWLVDTGPGSWNTLGLLGVDGARIGGVLLTHYHSDHIGDLGEVNLQTWTAGRPESLSVYGPPGVEQVVEGFSRAYAFDREYRTLHHGRRFMPPETGVMGPVEIPHPRYGEGATRVVDDAGLRIVAFPVRHDPIKAAYGYRFDYLGRSVVVSGDTAASPALVENAKETDVLVHDAMAKHIAAEIGEAARELDRPRIATIMADILDYHASATDAAEASVKSGSKLLVLTHLFPPPPSGLAERVYTRGVSDVREDGWVLGHDGMLISLPAGSDEIRVESLALR